MTLGGIDSYLIKPWWEYPDENFHRTITQFLYEWGGHIARGLQR
jgi:hypothetical protein